VCLNAAHTPLKPRGVYGLAVMLGNSRSETRARGRWGSSCYAHYRSEVAQFFSCITLRKQLVSKVPYSTLILLNAGRETGITDERRKS